MSEALKLVEKIEAIAADPKAAPGAIDGALNEMVTLLNTQPDGWDLCTDKVRFLLNERFCYNGPSAYGRY